MPTLEDEVARLLPICEILEERGMLSELEAELFAAMRNLNRVVFETENFLIEAKMDGVLRDALLAMLSTNREMEDLGAE